MSEEIQEALKRIKELEETLEIAKKCLIKWDRVNKLMLYPHQHNTGSQTKDVLKTIEEVI